VRRYGGCMRREGEGLMDNERESRGVVCRIGSANNNFCKLHVFLQRTQIMNNNKKDNIEFDK